MINYIREIKNEFVPRFFVTKYAPQINSSKIRLDRLEKKCKNEIGKIDDLDILFINHDESLTGAPKILIEIAKLLKIKYKTRMVSKMEGTNHAEYIKHFPDIIYPNKILHFVSKYDKARLILKVLKPKLVYVNSLSGVEYVMAAKELNIKSIFHIHELYWSFKKVLRKKEAETLKDMADCFITAGSGAKDVLIQRYGCDENKVKTIEAFIDIEDVLEKSKEEFKLVYENNNKNIMGLGSFNIRKGSDYFIDLAKINFNKNLNFYWLGKILYPNELGLILKSKINKKYFKLVDEVKNPYPYLKNSDIVVVPSRSDTFPLVVLEALALGAPVITFKESGRFVEYFKDALFIADGMNLEDLNNQINFILENPNGAESKLTLGKELVRNYDINKALPKIEIVVSELLLLNS